MENGTFAVLCFILTFSPLDRMGRCGVMEGWWWASAQLMLYTDTNLSKITFVFLLKMVVLSFSHFMANADYICN